MADTVTNPKPTTPNKTAPVASIFMVLLLCIGLRKWLLIFIDGIKGQPEGTIFPFYLWNRPAMAAANLNNSPDVSPKSQAF
ncbi:MAG: hypothetical protein ACFB0G_05630 [Leptolyngbyaceae cyanobacterium]